AAYKVLRGPCPTSKWWKLAWSPTVPPRMVETRKHVFCSVPFSVEVRTTVLQHLRLGWAGITWDRWWTWAVRISVGRTGMAKWRSALTAVFVYM
ncbi:hypothetical protein Dimus_011478, partial [Dionaea muscipula]